MKWGEDFDEMIFLGRGKRNNINSSSRLNAPERRTLPTDLPGTKRRTYNTKRSCQSPREEHHMQTSCSLPETPIFARGCDIPRTPHRRAPEIPGHRTTPRQSNTMGTLNMSTGTTSSSYRLEVNCEETAAKVNPLQTRPIQFEPRAGDRGRRTSSDGRRSR